jgi:hypothetical protein
MDPGQVAGDPGERSRISLLATGSRTKGHDTNLSVGTVAVKMHQGTATVTL